jgi:ubiquitin C-terminal hydrolase
MSFKPRGIINPGKTCYVNAVLQCLLRLPSVQKNLEVFEDTLRDVQHGRHSRRFNLTVALKAIAKNLLMPPVFAPLNLGSFLRNYIPDIHTECDASEFFLKLLNDLADHIATPDVIDAETTWPLVTFKGNIRNRIICGQCAHSLERYPSI